MASQIYILIAFFITGICIGLLFDIFRVSRKAFKTPNILIYIEDVLFWILSGIIVLYSIFIFNNGEMRLFMFLGIILGGIMYMVLLSSYIIKINVKIIKLIQKILEILFIPLKLIYKYLVKFLLKPSLFIFINIRKNITKFATKTYKVLKILKKEKNLVKNWKFKKELLKICRIYKYEYP